MAVTRVRTFAAALLLGLHLPIHAQDGAKPDAAAPDSTQATEPEAVLVTGSRVITDGNNSPTAIAVVTAEQLALTTPSNISDSLNKLPQFVGSRTQVDRAAGNFLNLRSIGEVRSLILFDGNRVAPSAVNGAIDVNTLPQLLIERVDVVTGGASAVYGSDAVSGVVNFVIDKNFTGLKGLAQSGMSEHGDNRSNRVGLAAGTGLFEGRGHIEGSLEYYDNDGIPHVVDRKNGAALYTYTGAGTAANPFRLTPNSRITSFSPFGHAIVGFNSAGQAVAPIDSVFRADGTLVPFQHGTPTGTPGTESGGDGAIFQVPLTAPLTTKQGYLRFDYGLNDDLNLHAQASYTDSHTTTAYVPFPILFRANVATISAQNAFLRPEVQADFAQRGITNFAFLKFEYGQEPVGFDYRTKANFANVGIDGKIGKFDWAVNYAFSESRLDDGTTHNVSVEKLAAGLDAIVAPASFSGSNYLLNSQGQRVICRTAITAPSEYPDCLPLNVFGPGTEDPRAVAAVQARTGNVLTNRLHTIPVSISGDLFATRAGPVRAAISGEYRSLTLRNVSNNRPSTVPDCVGLTANCAGSAGAYILDTSENAYGKQSVKEIAAEVNVPLLAGVAFAHSLNVNGAFRYTDYSTSGGVRTWKGGLDWHPVDELALRATRSRDIRAPTIYELYEPIGRSPTGYFDVLTNTSGFPQLQGQGNSELTPEIADTYTVGFVYRPSWLADFSVAADFYDIEITDAITLVSGANQTVQRRCNESGGTSPLCQLYVRPFPYSNTTAANFPTQLYRMNLNLSRIHTKGVDADIIYSPRFAGGDWSLRMLASYQPTLATEQLPGDAPIQSAGADGVPKYRITGFINYSNDRYSANLQERWHSSTRQSGDSQLVYDYPRTAARAFTDLSVAIKFNTFRKERGEFFVTVNNLFNTNAGIFPTAPGVPGFSVIVTNGDDIIGRSFVAGIRGSF